MKTKDVTRFNVDLRPELHAQLMARADELDMTGAQYVRCLLRKDLDAVAQAKAHGAEVQEKYPFI